MRCSHAEHARTLLFTTFLFVLSFTATLAESANVHGFRAHHAWRRRASLDVIARDQVPALTTPSVLPSITSALSPTVLITPTTPTSVPSVLPALQSPSVPSPSLPSPSLPSPSPPSPPANPLATTSSSSSSTPASDPTSTSATSAATPTTSNETPVSHSTSSQSPSSQSSSSSSTKPSTSTPTSAAPAVIATAPAAQPLGLTSAYTGTFTSFATGTTVSSTPSSTPSSNSGFFSNTGAVAGTFTVAGLLGVAGIIGTGMMIARRRVSRSYEDDMEYLEKKPEPSVEPSQSQSFVVGDAEESSDIDHFGNSMEVTVPPAAHFYSQQDVYHGQAANGSEGYENQGYYPHEVYAPHEYGIAYPPTEPYAAEDPYGGIDETCGGMPNPFDDVGSGLPAALQPSVQRTRTLIPPQAAYCSPDLHHSVDSFYGSSTGASNGHAM
ncbi:hypothetical protein DFJ58DRAFT_488530 [Suillus subalutaceus]|uniref:uncharacterized protein n=1 Tax=Suillus subalutaceus TaxID=48586 RepID=UPI001B85FA31|nr:uncharacterized protein DFJ58DRAFT_488530 [Suillus subalutaceus]KAG1846799.1 hypothetical protein DFJ58DRAFT_488530 [Suillus subalutaceus]